MAKLQGRKNKGTSFGKRQDADDAFRKKKKERGSYGKSDSRDGGAPRGEGRGFSRGKGGASRGFSGGKGRGGFGGGSGGAGRRGFGGGPGRSFGDRNESGRGFSRGEGSERRGGGGRSFGKPDGERSSSRGAGRSFGRKEGSGRGEFRGSSYEGGARKFSAGAGRGRPYKTNRFSDKEGGDKKPYRSNRFSSDRPDNRFSGDQDNKRPYRTNKFSDGEGVDKKPHRTNKFSGDQDGDNKKPFQSGKPGEREEKPFRKSKFSGDDRDKPRRPRRDKNDKGERRSFVESKLDNERRRADDSIRDERETTEHTEGSDRDQSAEQKQTRSRKVAEPSEEGGLIRLNKFISNSGVCSRREADELIKMGVITVNGTTITEMGYKVKSTDEVRHDGKKLTAEKPVYILLNKPKGFITTTDDPQERNTVMQLIAGACKERVYPVGRLDRNTTGLLLLTNDGELTDKLTHPSFNAKKIYKVELDKPLTKADFQRIVDGVKLEEGTAMVDDLAIVSDDNLTVGIELHIGWNHIVRRIFNALEYDVVKLDRVVYAGLDKKDLKRGQWRFLKGDEIVRLKHFK